MYLKQTPNKKTGRIYLSIVKGYRDKQKGYSTNKPIKMLGYLDDLQKEFDDPIAHFKQIAVEMTKAEETDNQTFTMTINLNEELPSSSEMRMNLGYAAILKIFHELKLGTFIRNKQRNRDFEYNTSSIMQLLVISRLLSPASKKRTFLDKARYFERFDFELHDVYRSLTFFADIKTEIQRHIHKQITNLYGRNTELVYYDVTNYYFEIDEQDELRKNGVSKEKRRDPIVQMGLMMDTEGIPIAYKLYPGNENDVKTLRPIIRELKTEYNMGRIIVVADKGIHSGDNINYLKTTSSKDGYVLSLSVLGSSEKFKKYVLDEEGYYHKKKTLPDGTQTDEIDFSYKIKSRLYARDIKVSKVGGGKMTKRVDEKQVIVYSKKYADKAKADRAEVVKKARDMCNNPSKYTQATSYGASKYVKNIQFDKDTGEIRIDDGQYPVFDENKLLEEEKYDGYYAIVTSEMDKSDDWIREKYKGLWEIEESFKITKSELEARPVHVSCEDHIEAHFLSCFIALVIIRLLSEKKVPDIPVSQILETLNKISCSYEDENLYLFDYRSPHADAIGNAIGVDFSKKRLTVAQIKNILANCKK